MRLTLALVLALALAGAAVAKPRPATGTMRAAMCRTAPPPGSDVHCVSATISGVAPRWGRAVYTYEGGGSGSRKQRVSWLHRRSPRATRWRLKTAVVTSIGQDRPPCGKVPLAVLREYYGRRACT